MGGVAFPFLKDFHFHDPIARGERGGGLKSEARKFSIVFAIYGVCVH